MKNCDAAVLFFDSDITDSHEEYLKAGEKEVHRKKFTAALSKLIEKFQLEGIAFLLSGPGFIRKFQYCTIRLSSLIQLNAY